MMTFHHITRRLHLYLGMFLLPWFFIYGLSSVVFNYGAVFKLLYRDGIPDWSVRFDRPYEISIPQDADLQEIGAQILKDNGLEGAFSTHRPNERQLNVYLFDFWSHTRLIYFVDQKRLLAEDRRFRWDHFLTGMHARGGFQQASFLHDAWAVTVDIVCVAIVLWIATGIYMWWKLPQTRWWGAIALGGGAISFLVFLVAL
jgi:hypothetical protein